MGITVSAGYDGVLEIVIEAPPVNALTIADQLAIARAVREAGDDESIHVIVLRGAGRGFSAGGDLKEALAASGNEGALNMARGSSAACTAIAECAVPVIAAVHGFCVGVGVMLVGMCDLVVAASGTSFALTEIDVGATVGTAAAMQLLPSQRARAAMYTGQPVDVAELQAHGSVLSVVPEAELVETAMTLARVIASKHPAVLRAMKATADAISPRPAALWSRTELSHTFELNLSGAAQEARARNQRWAK